MDNVLFSPGRGVCTLDLEHRADGRIEGRQETLAGRFTASSFSSRRTGGRGCSRPRTGIRR